VAQRRAVPAFGAANANYKGDKAGRWAMHKRANKVKSINGKCERCPAPGQVIHHKDENPRNNDISNLERLCRACHALHHIHERAARGERANLRRWPA
jgi:hypothetical protein